jgi:hypothetical protein
MIVICPIDVAGIRRRLLGCTGKGPLRPTTAKFAQLAVRELFPHS